MITMESRKPCGFCGMTYLANEVYAAKREQRTEITASGWTSLIRGVDETGKVFIIAEGEDDSDRYYPKFCPECGRKLQ